MNSYPSEAARAKIIALPGLPDTVGWGSQGIRTASAEMERARALEKDGFPTGVPCLDAVGLQKGSINEVVAEGPGAGAGLLLDQLLAGGPGQGQGNGYVALIDGSDSFDPRSAGVAPGGLRRLLWLRCQRGAAEALKAADWLLRDGNLSLVVLDLHLNPGREFRRVPGSTWHRLRLQAETTGAVLLALTPEKLLSCAQTRLRLSERFSLAAFDTPRERLVLHPAVERRQLRPAWGPTKANPDRAAAGGDAVERMA